MKIAFAYDSTKGTLESRPRYRWVKAWADAAGAELVAHDVAGKPISGAEITHLWMDELEGK